MIYDWVKEIKDTKNFIVFFVKNIVTSWLSLKNVTTMTQRLHKGHNVYFLDNRKL